MLLHDPSERRSSGPPLWLRVNVWRRRLQLDTALAGGADPARDPALELRAHQLTRLSTRQAIAKALHNLLHAAEEPPEGWGGDGPRPPLRRGAVLAAGAQLTAVADRLCERQALPPASVALAALLVWDSASPMYSANTDATVAEWADAVIAASGHRGSLITGC